MHERSNTSQDYQYQNLDRPGQTRPIPLIDDIYSFLCTIVAKYMSNALERTGLESYLKAYRKNKSTSDISITEACMKEDAEEAGTSFLRLEQDEQKFFDRISLAMQLAAMICFGFPEEGYMEFKCEDVTDRYAVIKTRSGQIIARYFIGLP